MEGRPLERYPTEEEALWLGWRPAKEEGSDEEKGSLERGSLYHPSELGEHTARGRATFDFSAGFVLKVDKECAYIWSEGLRNGQAVSRGQCTAGALSPLRIEFPKTRRSAQTSTWPPSI